jgi:hypothetical protein
MEVRLDNISTIWYVITRKDNGYPLTITPDKERAKFIAKINRENLVAVKVEKLIDF